MTTWPNGKSFLLNKKKHFRSDLQVFWLIHRRVKEFRSELSDLRTRFDSLKRLHSESVVSQNRSELFGRRTFHSSTPENPYVATNRINSDLTREQGMLRENTFLQRTEGQLDEFIGRGMAVLDNLVEQRGFLKVNLYFGLINSSRVHKGRFWMQGIR